MPAKIIYGPEIRAKIASMRLVDDMSIFQIADAMNMNTATVAHILAADAPIKAGMRVGTNIRRGARGNRPNTAPRKCLKCRTSFPSEGAHNQICAPCGHQNSHSDDRFGVGYSVIGR